MIVDIIGWMAAVAGTVLGLPQVLRIWRTKDTEGVSALTWQLMLAVQVSWLVHGLKIAAPNIIVVNIIGAVLTLLILWLIAAHRQQKYLWVVVPGLLIAAGLVGVDLGLGTVWFGLLAAIPGVGSLIAQAVSLVRAPQIEGVSLVFLIVALVNFGLWLTWGLLVRESALIIANLPAVVVCAFNIAWFLRRTRQAPGTRDLGNGGRAA